MNKHLAGCFLAMTIFLTAMEFDIRGGQESDICIAFSTAYREWKTYLSTNLPIEVMSGSSIHSSIFYNNVPFRKIVALGPAALPCILHQLSQDRILTEAFFRITKWQYHILRRGDTPTTFRWIIEDLPELSTTGGPPDRIIVLNYWWKEGRFKTGERFTELYGKWKSLKKERREQEAEGVYERIANLGIPVLPYLIEKLEESPELAAAVSKLTDGAVMPTATASECRMWWAENKKKYEILFKPEAREFRVRSTHYTLRIFNMGHFLFFGWHDISTFCRMLKGR